MGGTGIMLDSLAQDILAHGRRAPGAPALLWNGTTLTYGELAALADTAAVRLAAPDLRGDAPVAVRAVKSPTSLALVLACLLARRTVLLLSPDLGRPVAARLAERAGCGGLLVPGTDGDAALEAVPGPARPASPGAALLLTTSGSTKLPKTVRLSRAALDRFTRWAGSAFPLGAGHRVLSYAPLNFDLSLFDVWATLRHGGCVIPVDPGLAADPRYAVRLLRQTRPEVVQAVPTLLRPLAGAGTDAAPFTSVRHVLLTGEHTPRSLRARLARLFPRAEFHNVYGCTETNDSLLYSCGAREAADLETLPLGSPLPGARVRLVGGGGRELDGPGTGELLVHTPFQADGYLGAEDPDDRFVRPAPGSSEPVWFRTGDLVRRDSEGALTLVGRDDFQVKVGGVRVSPEAVEQVAQSHPEVLEAAVVALAAPGPGTRLHALVRVAPDCAVTGLQLLTHCSAWLPRAAVPTVHLTREPLPTGLTGKVDRAQVRSVIAARHHARSNRPTQPESSA
ncbi:AMP-binding protein [Streptomyces kroppenstedtii]|uniref:AMP-binding protein n=1 Tax=Streptomyces kroppenstedtii TaxID=3051181 RepID=UPI0028D39840|nr:AMP-binding protein [Streptomyces sp. DSM 40484]